MADTSGTEDSADAGNLKATGESEEYEVKLCQFFQMGKCHFGQKCRLSHSDPLPDDSGTVPPDMDDQQDEETTKKHKKKGSVSKGTKPKYNEGKEVNKKPRMRTADDVISRILWDSSVDASDFVVGYVDRFLGVLERPFSDFNWDTNPCDCDYTTELALPRHRIQYFTYRGHRVWDRHTRTDRVFGSTGQSLAPPFGGEGEVNEMNSAEEEQQDDIEEKPHLEEEDEQNKMKVDTPAPECRQDQESQGARDAEEAANGLQTSIEFRENEEGDEETLPECEESWEDNKDGTISQNPAAPLEQRGARPPKKRPTHFITFRANTPAILSCFQQLQEELTALLPSSAPHWQPASSLHVTLCLLVLRGPAEVAAAAEILRQFARLDRNPPVAVTFPVKLKHFNGKVLYLSPQPHLHLQQLNSGLQEAYGKEGWLHRDSRNPRFHLTLAKVEGPEGERIFEGVGAMKAGKGLNFGRLPVNTLHLCAMGYSTVDDFYETVCKVTLR